MNTLNRYLQKLAVGVAAGLLMVSTSMSDDIDLYVNPPSTSSLGETLVVFTMDLRAEVMASSVCTSDRECDELFKDAGMFDQLNDDGSTSYFLMLVAVLKKVLYSLNNDNIKVALMIPHANTGGNQSQCTGFQGKNPDTGCSNGGYVLSAFRSTGDTTEMDKFFEKLEAIPAKDGGNAPHEYQLKELFFEMYRFFSNGYVYNGENGWENWKTDATYNIDDPEDTISVYQGHDEPTTPVAELMWDTDAVDASSKRYINSLDTAEHCTDIFSVNISAAKADKDDSADGAMAETRENGGFGFDPDSNQSGRLQVIEHLAGIDLSPDPESDTDSGLVGNQSLTSFFITEEGGRAVSTANAWADAGGTGSAVTYQEDPDDLLRVISSLFNEIEGTSTTYVSASVPANVFNRAETLNEVFLAIFEPNDDDIPKPFWVGNVKKLTTRTIESESCDSTGDCTIDEEKILVDVLEADAVDPESAINPLDGRIRAEALTYWTRTGDNNAYLPAPTTEEEEKEFTEGTDGRKVDRGGAGQVKPGYLGSGSPGDVNDTTSNTTISGPRKIFTEADNDDSATSGLVNLDADSGANTAVNLLTDGRSYPGSSLTYGDYLFQTVMSDCSGCASSYSDASGGNQNTAEDRVNNLIRYARGYDFTDIDTATGGKRAWWQSDPLHTRPLALNYGARGDYTQDRPDIRIVLGGNDGMVQMIRDGRKSDGSEDGVEAWAFLPREFVPLQKRLLEATSGLYDPGQPYDPPHEPLHPYAMDGAPSALIIDNNLDGTINAADPPSTDDPDTPEDETLDGGDQAYVFIGQRRGGKRYYALDVSNPDNPKYLWSIGKGDSSGDFAEMGQSWSLMRAGVMAVDEGGTVYNRPVLVFSGGYNGDDGGDGGGDLGKDSRVKNHDSGTEILGTDDDEGNALFIVNALTGDLIWKAVDTADTDTAAYDSAALAYKHPYLNDSVAASPAVLDSTGDGLIDRVYFPDTGGNVWRMDAGGANRSNWTVTKLFAGGRHVTGLADNDHDRRFIHTPDVVFAEDEFGKFDAVILGSGDRAHPFGATVENWMYMIKDRATTSGNPPGSTLFHDDLADLTDPTDNCLQNGTCDAVNGWKLQLKQCEAGGIDPKCGEKSLATPLTIDGTIYFTTYLPVLEADTSTIPATCGPPEGSGLFYAVDLQTAGAAGVFGTSDGGSSGTPNRFERLKSPGIPSEPVAISPNEILRPDLEVQKTEGTKKAETFWYERRFN